MSTLGSRASSYLSVPSSRASILSDPRSSIASTDSSFTHYSAASSRLSTASSRLSTISNTSAPKNFACTFCDKALKSKPYWKSHEEEFHEQRLTWRCPDCEQIFHAGKRFREHHTKLHVCHPAIVSPLSIDTNVHRVVKTANNLEKVASPPAAKHRPVSRSMRLSCTTRMLGGVDSVLACCRHGKKDASTSPCISKKRRTSGISPTSSWVSSSRRMWPNPGTG